MKLSRLCVYVISSYVRNVSYIRIVLCTNSASRLHIYVANREEEQRMTRHMQHFCIYRTISNVSEKIVKIKTKVDIPMKLLLSVFFKIRLRLIFSIIIECHKMCKDFSIVCVNQNVDNFVNMKHPLDRHTVKDI